MEREEQLRALADPVRVRIEELARFAEPIFPGLDLFAESQRAINDRLAFLDAARLNLEPLDRLAEEARATVERFDEVGRRLARFYEQDRTVQLALERSLTVPRELAAQLARVGGISEEQERALRAIGSVHDSLSGIFQREQAAMAERERIIAESVAAISRTSELCDLARVRFAALPFDSIGQLAGFNPTERAAAVGRFSVFATSYQDLAGWISSNVPRPWELPDFLTARPARDLFASVETLDVLSLPREWEPEDDRGDDGDAPLADLLAEMHPDLPGMWRGVRRTLEDRHNPARVRMVAAVTVELCIHTLRVAAPDALVRPWARPDHYLDDGRLRHRARWEYLARDIDSVGGRFGSLMEAAVADLFGILGELQQAKHQLGSDLTPGVARVLLARVGAALRTIYIVWKAQRN